jgi:predicted HAD superfamily hydrolase
MLLSPSDSSQVAGRAAPAGAQPVALFTFDVFDTLVTRVWLRPADVFLHAELLNARAGRVLGSSPWSARRAAAEARLRRATRHGEVTLEQIYRELAAELGWSEQDMREAMAVEIDCELRASRRIGAVADRFATLVAQRCRVACVSDFYAPRGFILDLLSRAGVPVSATDVFVSSDEQLTKKSGALFHRVRQHYSLQPAEICHTGDHPWSDVRQATQAGVAVKPYLRSAPSVTELTLGSWGSSTRDRLLGSAIAGAARRARIDRELQGRLDVVWSIATGIAGPLLFGYVYWILFTARELGLRRLYFLARDGQILLQIARQIDSRCALDLDLRYLHASRRAWFLPSAAMGTVDERVAAILSDPTVSISDLLHSLEIDSTAVRDALRDAGFPEDTWARKIDSNRLRTVLCRPPFAALIHERARSGLELCVEYLGARGLLDGVSDAIVDIGWKGRLQAALARILRGVNAPDPTGFYLGLRERPDESAVGPMLVYLEGPDAGILNPTLVELFSAADHGSTLGYARAADGHVQPILAEADRAAVQWGLEVLQEGINSFSATMLDALSVLDEPPARLSAGLRQSALLAMRRLVRQPTAAEAAVLGSFPHAAGQFHQDLSELAPHIPVRAVLQALLSPAFLSGRTHWPQASIVRSAPAPQLTARLWDLRCEGIPRLKRWFRRASQTDSPGSRG